ncbi:MAG TPA: UDP-N-acetylglucosamine 1-carboxyvinyltransferase [Planctomycetota bacterium]|nr:UDP-N-acetylglucosamine 1-carboxyvinyltransferase [Planctomycetota bacterium]
MSGTAESGGRFVIEGGVPIEGVVTPAGNKNEALPVLAASLLVSGETVVERVPRIADANAILEILSRLGVRVSYECEDTVALDASNLKQHDPDRRLCSEIRGSFLLAPGLLHRTGRAVLPRPGGDRIGRRRVDTHLLALKALGAEVDASGSEYRIDLPGGRFRGAEIFLDEASVMATENAVMAAAVAEGGSRIMNAACEPHVQGLCRLLVSMGASIRGIGTNFLEVEGVKALAPTRHRIGPDHIEIGSFLAIAAMTRGSLRIKDVRADDLRMIRMVFRRLGVETTIEGADLIMPSSQSLEVVEDLHGAVPKVDDAPWPGFPADLTSMALVLATQAKGTVLIHEKMFESRLFFVDRLISMGARVVLCDPHRALVVGPSALHGAVMASPDIRAGMALVAAALCAEGQSVIMNAHQVDRGYERIDERLRQLGARISRVSP